MSKNEKYCEDHFPIVYNTQGDTQQPIYQLANYEGDTQQPIFQLANYEVCSAELSDIDWKSVLKIQSVVWIVI